MVCMHIAIMFYAEVAWLAMRRCLLSVNRYISCANLQHIYQLCSPHSVAVRELLLGVGPARPFWSLYILVRAVLPLNVLTYVVTLNLPL